MSQRAEQAALPLLDALPERPDLLESIATRPVPAHPVKWRHTGRRFLEKLRSDGDLAEMVCEGLALGYSVRLLALRCGVSPNTIAAVRVLMTERGELEAVRIRADRLLDQVVEESMEYWLEGMRAGVISPGQIPIPALAAWDKKGQRDAGLVAGTSRTGEEITEERVAAQLRLLEERARRRAEGASGGRSDGATAYAWNGALDTELDTGGPGGPVVDVAVVAVPVPAPEACAPASTTSAPGGGGSGQIGAGMADGLGLENDGGKSTPFSPGGEA